MDEIKKENSGSYSAVLDLHQWMIDYMEGKKTLPFTYDPFFKYIFNPDVHPERLGRFISALLGRTVQVKRSLSTEGNIMEADGSLLIMDIVVELEDGSLANVEIQKIPYDFPAERMSCYSSDLVMRQYMRIRSESKDGQNYRGMHKVYTIILFERSTAVFHEFKKNYIHSGKVQFNTGIKLNLLQEYCLIALDIFREFHYDKNTDECSGWLSFLVCKDVREAEHLMQKYPWLTALYEDAFRLRTKSREVEMMFSEALRILDRNTVQYMIDEQQNKLNKQQEKLDEQQEKLDEQQEKLDEQQEKLDEQQEKLDEQQEKLDEQQEKLKKQAEEIKRLLEENARLKAISVIDNSNGERCYHEKH